MNISPVSSNNFKANHSRTFGYYGKQGPVLEDVFYGYTRNLKDSDVIFIEDKNGNRKPVVVGNLRTLAIQEQHPNYRYLFNDNATVENKIVEGTMYNISAGDIRKEFAQEELIANEERKTPHIVNYIV